MKTGREINLDNIEIIMQTSFNETSIVNIIDNTEPLENVLPLRLTSIVVKGYGRGSNDLGIPTANLSREKIKFNLGNASFDDLPTGVYYMAAKCGVFCSLCNIKWTQKS